MFLVSPRATGCRKHGFLRLVGRRGVRNVVSCFLSRHLVLETSYLAFCRAPGRKKRCILLFVVFWETGNIVSCVLSGDAELETVFPA